MHKILWSRLLQKSHDEHSGLMRCEVKSIFGQLLVEDFDQMKRRLMDTLEFCQAKCGECKGLCIGAKGHSGAHRHFHVPLLFKGRPD